MEETLSRLIDAAHAALNESRHAELARFSESLGRTSVIGVFGEPEVGVTTFTTGALAPFRRNVVRLDLDGVADIDDVAWVIARGLARALLLPTEMQALMLPAGLTSSETRRASLKLHERLGPDLAALAAKPVAPAARTGELDAALDALASFDDELMVWIDHLQAPDLAPRHPVDARKLLWTIRARQQRTRLAVVVSGNASSRSFANARNAAFVGDGEWLTIGRPQPAAWVRVAHAIGLNVSESWTEELAALTDGHPQTMLLALISQAHDDHSSRRPEALLRDLAWRDDGHLNRALLHARTLHRLGGRVLEQLATREKPYAGRDDARKQEAQRAIKRLHAAGLIWQPRRLTWQITNPLIALRLNRGVALQAPVFIEDEAADVPAGTTSVVVAR